MSYLTDKYGSNAAAKAATSSPSKTYGAGTGTVNKSSSNSSSSSNTSSSSTPSAAISYNTPSSNNTSNVSLSSPSDNSYNGGSQSEWDYYFGEDDNDTSNEYWEAYLAQQAAAEAAQKKAIQDAVDQSVNTLNAQKTTTSQDYADAYRQLYLNNMKSQKNIGQQMAAQGVTGGASESTLLGLNTNYEDNLRQGKVAEQNALSELDTAIANAKLSGSIEAANNTATNAQNTANAYLTAWQQQLAADQAAAEQEQAQASENRQYAYQLAMAMLQNGTMPSTELLNQAGISTADAQTIVAQYVAAKNASSSGNSDTDTTGGDTASTIMASAQWLANNQGKSAALAYLKKAYNGTAFNTVSGDKLSVYNSMVNSINNMF